jgi:hypothetical protein
MNSIFVIPESGPTNERVASAIHELRDALTERYGQQFVFMVYGGNRKLACHTSKRIIEPKVEASVKTTGG